MLIPALTVRRCLLAALVLAALVQLADNIARYELRQAAVELTMAAANTGSAGASGE